MTKPDRLLDLEDLPEEEIDRIKHDLVQLARAAKQNPDHLSIDV